MRKSRPEGVAGDAGKLPKRPLCALAARVFLLAVLCGGLANPGQSAESIGGTYTIQGGKGVVTLILQQAADGKVTGSLKGGETTFLLNGIPQPDGSVVGTATTEQGQFASYFQAAHLGGQLALDLIGADATGRPDAAKRTRLAFSVPGSGAAASPDSGGFTGTFKDGELTFESRATGGGYAGTINMGGQNFPFTANATGETMTGTFETKDGKFEFTAIMHGANLQFVTGGTTYTLAPQAAAQPRPANPLARAGGFKNAAPAKPDVPALPQGGPGEGGNWKVFQHATGLSMCYPADWTLTQLPNAVQLVPPDVATNAMGPAEAYFVLAQGAQGVTLPDDPRVIQYFNQEMAKLVPFLRPSGQAEHLRTGTAPGILLTWEGTSPAGLAVRSRMCVTILKGYAVALLALGDQTRIAARDYTVREIFASFAAGAGERDPRVAGAWKFWSYLSSADGRFGTTTDRRFRLQADGTCYWSSSGENSGTFKGTNSLGETTWTGGVAGRSGAGPKRGQWSAANGSLYVLWGDGSASSWDYQVTGAPGNRRLILKGSGAKPDEWIEGK